MKIIVEFFQLSNGQGHPDLTACDQEEKFCESFTMALLDFAAELHSPADAMFGRLLSAAGAVEYVLNNLQLAGFSIK